MAGITGVSPIDASISTVRPIVPRAEHAAGGMDFAGLLREQLDQVVDLNSNAEQLQQQFAAGEISDINEVVLAMSKADLALTFALELRNKVVEAYQEISRTQL
jgi:flagellar hook-basal body complex protein FliE